MCGIAGFVDLDGRSSPGAREAVVERMAASLEHRGPDDAGTWAESGTGVALGSRRLAVIDLSPAGHLPMVSASGRHVIAFNGEVYNFEALRDELGDHGFRGRSDTEVLLAAVEAWGLRRALERANGMFAFALWDREERALHVVRDRMGEKPVYYGRFGSAFVFASELKAFREHPAFHGTVDRQALAQFMRHKYVPAPRSIYEGVSKLPPGSILSVGADGRLSGPVAYWSVQGAAERGLADPFEGTPDEAADELEALLRDSVRMRMLADVPVGAFLSGGIDSSTVVSLMQAESGPPARTFTIGFHDAAWDEARDARRVAEHLGTDHTELLVTPDEARAVIPRLPEIYDEPFADSSQIPSFLVAQLARRSVTVALSGDGGDEVFGGYNRYRWGRAVSRRTRWMPGGLRRVIAGSLTAVSPRAWDRMARTLSPLLPGPARQRLPGEKVHKLARALSADDPDAMYASLVSHWLDPSAVVVGAEGGGPWGDGRVAWNGTKPLDPTARMMMLDSRTYLPDDILVKLDRATMAVSLEGRVPYLDHRVVELAWRLPLELKVGDGTGKWVLRRVLHRHVPPALVARPKMGFGVPVGDWLRGPLREWAEELLAPARLRREGYLEPGPIRAAWSDHLSGRRNRQYELWDVLMFQAWLEATERAEARAR